LETGRTARPDVSASLFRVALIAFAIHQLLHAAVVMLHGGAPYLFCQYDCNWYVEIIENGYMPEANDDAGGSRPQSDVANWAFFPLFPIISGTVYWITDIAPQIAVIMSAKALWLLAIWAFLAFQRQYLPGAPLWLGAAVVALSPAAIYANTGYTEPLFLLLACLSLTAMRQDRPILAGALGALLTATRVVGLGVGLAFAAHALNQVIRKSDVNAGKLLFAGMLIPLGIAGYMIFLHFYVGDAMAFSHIQRAWDRELSSPFYYIKTSLRGSTYHLIMALTALTAFALAGYLAWKGEWGLALFLFFATAIPVSTGTSSMGRYVVMQPAFLLAVVMLMHTHRWLRAFLAPFALGYLWMSYAWQDSLFFVI
jgi:hypothetical protein